MVLFAEDEKQFLADSAHCRIIVVIVIKVCEEFMELRIAKFLHAVNTSVLKSLPTFGHERQRRERA